MLHRLMLISLLYQKRHYHSIKINLRFCTDSGFVNSDLSTEF